MKIITHCYCTYIFVNKIDFYINYLNYVKLNCCHFVNQISQFTNVMNGYILRFEDNYYKNVSLYKIYQL